MKFKPFAVKHAVGESGPLIDRRNDLIDIIEHSDETIQFREIKTKRRNRWRAKRHLANQVAVTCDEEIQLPLEPKDYPVYVVDDLSGANPNPPIIAGYYTPLQLSDYQILDSVEISNKGMLVRTTDGRLICCKLSSKKRSNISLERWVAHISTLLTALSVQRNNPRGERKKGVFRQYILLVGERMVQAQK